jgi:hypothetical protein
MAAGARWNCGEKKVCMFACDAGWAGGNAGGLTIEFRRGGAYE